MLYRKLVAVALIGTQCGHVLASYEKIAGYSPGSQVTDHNAIDLDQDALESALGDYAFATAKTTYEDGGFSKNYAEITIGGAGLASAVSKSDKVACTGTDGATSEGKMYAAYAGGAATIKIAYATSDVQATYVKCRAGGTTAEQTGCFDITADCVITTGTSTTVTVAAADMTAISNKNGRTLQSFSTKAAKYMKDCTSDRATNGCPYFDFKQYYDYYGDADYADKFVSAAIAGTATTFTNTEAQMTFTAVTGGKAAPNDMDKTRVQIIKKGTAYMNAYMYAIREFEDAIDDCKAGCTTEQLSDDNCNSESVNAVHAWDEGVAFYTGSKEGVDGSGSGKLFYNLADKRCENFKTCTGTDGLKGTSSVNDKLFKEMDVGQYKLLLGHCEAVRPVVRKMVAQMAVPLIQGTLRYAYKVDKLSGGAKEKAEGAVFAAAVVPRVAYCSAADATTIMTNMKIGAASTTFASVKTAFENNYACMNVTCADVGGLWLSAESKYYAGAERCSDASTAVSPTPSPPAKDEEKVPTWGLIVIIVLGGLVVAFLALCVCACYKEKTTGRPVFSVMSATAPANSV